MAKILVLGAGSWGTTLANLLAKKGNDVILWEFFKEQAEKIKEQGENVLFLPGITLAPMEITSDISVAAKVYDLMVFAVPSHVMRKVANIAAGHLNGKPVIVSVAKGIENETLKRMTEVLTEELPAGFRNNIVALSGPSHAEEVSRELPTTVVVASSNEEAALYCQELFMTPTFRIYTNDDLIGVELGGSLKNIIAIANGICSGLNYGDNTAGALLTRGLAEISRLGIEMGAKPLTFAGLSGMGDLITTCISKHSRNTYVGEELGKGKKLDDILKNMVMVAEGVRTTKSAYFLARKYSVELPITEQVYQVLFEGKDPRQAVDDLMLREAKAEC